MKSRMDAPLCVAGQETLHMVKFWYLLFYNILERIVFFGCFSEFSSTDIQTAIN